MAPFISAPSAQAHLWLPRQPTRTLQVCMSPALGGSSSQGCCGTWGADTLWLGVASRRGWKMPPGGPAGCRSSPPPQVSTGTPGTGGAVRGPGPSHAGEDGHRVSSIRHLLNRRRRASAMCQALAWTGGRPAWLVCTSCRFLFKCHLLDEAFPVAPHLKSPNPLFIADAVLLCQYPLRSLLPFLWAGIPSVCSLPAASTCVSF